MSAPAVKVSKARAKLLDTATRLFYTEGVNTVGIDRVIAEAGVTRATLYRHFPSKQQLVTTYVEEADRAIREQVAELTSSDLSPADALRAIANNIADGIRSPHFRGCAFLNAAAEFPDPADPVHQAVLAHRAWFLALVLELFAALGGDSEDAARRFVMLRDGAMVAGCLTDPDGVSRTFLQGVDALLP
ncbi:TetR family transcriptional regulator [Aeromicrobium sp. Root236]|uniref:TetR/AcrR family transcriptional regulator n=1 Tax=Aeromicrobium sp. Root236 TaxID=1736498 RepID=UPI0006FF51DD|nr:TetR/AcrR family transcriptional regulator [Aeromicrobium sp. Root236]KRC64491.1 TetR family transcriptional regulator [Aeromicrobium sp. Root236]